MLVRVQDISPSIQKGITQTQLCIPTSQTVFVQGCYTRLLSYDIIITLLALFLLELLVFVKLGLVTREVTLHALALVVVAFPEALLCSMTHFANFGAPAGHQTHEHEHLQGLLPSTNKH